MLVFWDVDGKKIVEHESIQAQAADNLCGSSAGDVRSISEALKKALGSKPEALKKALGSKPEALYNLCAEDSLAGNNVLDAVYPDGKRYRVKIFRDKSLGDHARHRRAVKKLARECAGIDWMSTAPGCASLVHQVLIRRELESDNGDGPPFLVTPYPQGAPLYGHFSELSEQRKSANLRSYARLVRAMFRVPCPAYIGTVVACSVADDVAQIGPCVHPFDGERAPSVYTRIDDYFGWLLHKKRALLAEIEKNENATGGAAGTEQAKPGLGADVKKIRRAMRRLEAHLAQDIRELDEPLLRCVPVLEDMSPRNVWIDAEGRITGIADWGSLVVKPAVLAAEYPEWLDYPDTEHPALNAKDGRYMEQSVTAERLCVEVEEVLFQQDVEYYNAMKDGIFLRMAEAWLKDATSDLAQLEAVISHAVEDMV